MTKHRSMRIDGPAWRGRPLGHRFDPLRCQLATMEPRAFEELIFDLLDVHHFRASAELPAEQLVSIAGDGAARLVVGTLYNTWE